MLYVIAVRRFFQHYTDTFDSYLAGLTVIMKYMKAKGELKLALL